jgi:hypothetical protein
MSIKFPSREEMEARFHELAAQRAAILAKSGPLREARDAHANAARDKELAMNAEIAEAEAGLVDLDLEAGMIARALGGRTGYAPGTEPEAEATAEEPAAEA